MKNDLLQFAQNGISISLLDLLIGLTLAILLGVLVVFVYRWTRRGFHYERSFLITLAMTPAVVAVVMMLIGSNLALSLGMVGALSIIRFRTVIKDSRDMVFLFLAIAVGLGCGTYSWMVITVSTLFLSGVLLVMHLFRFGKAMHADYVLVLAGNSRPPTDDLKTTIKNHVDYLEVRSVDFNDDNWEMVFEVRFFKDRAISETSLLDELKHKFGVQRISFLAPQLSLPV